MNFIRKILVAFKFLFDSKVALRRKIPILLGFLYFILPIDFIPDPVLGLGIIDDFVILSFIIHKLSEELDKYIINKEQEEKEKNFKDKIIEDVKYHVEDDK